MEALLILLGSMLGTCLAAVAGVVASLLSVLVAAISQIVRLVAGSSPSGKRTGAASAADGRDLDSATTGKGRVLRKFALWASGVLLGLGVLAVASCLMFFEPILRYGLDRTGEATGMEIAFDKAEGSLLSGRVELEGVSLRRDGSENELGFDLTVEQVKVDVALWSLLFSPKLHTAEVVGLRGFLSLPAEAEGNRAASGKRPKKRRSFTVQSIRVQDVDLDIRPSDREAYPFRIAQAEVEPFRSQLALFDLLFRSNMEAEVAGQSLVVETREITARGRETLWRFEEIETEQLKLLLPRTPLTWLRGGTVSARVDDRWSLSEDLIEMDWHLSLNGVEVEAPESAGRAEQLLATAAAKTWEGQEASKEFHYRLELDPQQLATMRSGGLKEFWRIFLSGFVRDAAGGTSTGEQQEGGAGRTLDRLKEMLPQKGSQDQNQPISSSLSR